MLTKLNVIYTILNVLISAIKKGQVSPLQIDMIINKKDKPLMKRLSSKRFLKPMNMDDIIAKLGTREGKAEIIREVGKGESIESIILKKYNCCLQNYVFVT